MVDRRRLDCDSPSLPLPGRGVYAGDPVSGGWVCVPLDTEPLLKSLSSKSVLTFYTKVFLQKIL